MSLVEMPPAVLFVAALTLAVLVVAASFAAFRELRVPVAKPPARNPRPATPADPGPGAVRRTVRHMADRLRELSGRRQGFARLPLLAVLGATPGDLRRSFPDLEDAGSGIATPRMSRRHDGQVLLSPEGAVFAFDDGLLSGVRPKQRWSELIGTLIARRDDRPLDGIVIVVAAGQLVGPDRLTDEALRALGEQLYELIRFAQRTGGWRVPVYLLVDGCEGLYGLTATVKQMPPQARREPLGWISPYGLDTVFERSWIQSGVAAVVNTLSALQFTLLMQPGLAESAEPVLLFPQSVLSLADPLATLLGATLRPSAYHQAFMFRGFFLVGRAGPGKDPGSAAFAPRLFAERIFPEHVLASPVKGAATRRRRRIIGAQAALAATAVLALFCFLRLQDTQPRLAPIQTLMDQIGAYQQSMLAGPFSGTGPADNFKNGSAASAQPSDPVGAPTDAPRADRAQTLLALMATISLDGLHTGWAPLSLLLDNSQAVQDAIRVAFRTFVLDVLAERLIYDIPSLLRVSGTDNSPILPCSAAGAAEGDVDRLTTMAGRLVEYQRQLRAYQMLPETGDIRQLYELVRFTLSVQLPPSFLQNYDLYRGGLKGASIQALPMPFIVDKVAGLVAASFDRGMNAAYPGSGLARAVMTAVANAGPAQPGTPLPLQFQTLRDLSAAIAAVQLLAPDPGYAWLRGGHSPPITDALASVRRLRSAPAMILGPYAVPADLDKQLAAAADACRGAIIAALQNAKVFGDTPVLDLQQHSPRLFPTLVPVLAATNGFLALPLSSTPLTRSITIVASDTAPLVWDTQELRALQDLTESYVAFAVQSLSDTLPASFVQQVTTTAGNALDAAVSGLVARAQRRGTERTRSEGVGAAAQRDEIDNFAAAAPVLTNVRAALQQAGLAAPADRLNRLLTAQALRLLGRVDTLLTSADPYHLADPSLAFWDGAPPLAATAFGAGSQAELVATLPARRDFVETLARDNVTPLLQYVTQSGPLLLPAAVQVVKRWQSITETLNRYHAGDPSNELSQLEQFIAAGMDQIDPTNCGRATLSLSGAGWFGQQLQAIRSAIARRCRETSATRFSTDYGQLAAAFNSSLAGRFPFAPASAPDADPGDVRRFFDQFGSIIPALRTQANAVEARFLAQLADAQAALVPMVADPAPNAPLSYDVEVDFRTNAGNDPGADQVIEAEMQLGKLVVSSFSAAKQSAWTANQPVAIRLRWAKNAPGAPVQPSSGQPKVNGLTASFDYGGGWALLRLLVGQAPAPGILTQLGDRRPGTVSFTVPLHPNPDAAIGGDRTLAVAEVFMRIGLTATVRAPGQPDKHVPVTLPAFPPAAPPGNRAQRL